MPPVVMAGGVREQEGRGEMTATILKMPRSSLGRIECSSCGATTDAACNCGAPYVAAKERAAAAVMAHPEMSDRAIAAEIGVSAPTVGKARKETVNEFTVDKRIGMDGKARRMPVQSPPTAGKDLISPSDADRAIVMIAEHVNHGILLPGPGILDCLIEAMSRASDEHRAAIVKASHTLSKLAEKSR